MLPTIILWCLCFVYIASITRRVVVAVLAVVMVVYFIVFGCYVHLQTDKPVEINVSFKTSSTSLQVPRCFSLQVMLVFFIGWCDFPKLC